MRSGVSGGTLLALPDLEMGSGFSIDALFDDVRHGSRALARNPGFSVAALAMLAIGIGASTAIFSFVDAVLLKPLPYESADRIVRVLETRPAGGTSWFSTPNYLDWRSQASVFEALAAEQQGLATLTSADEPVPLRVARVSANFFDVFGVKPALGRTFVAGEDVPGHDNVVVLGNRLWQEQYGGDADIVGRTIRLDDAPYSVVGVLARDDALNRTGTQIWHPLALDPAASRAYRWLNSGFGLLRPGVSIDEARAEMSTIAARLGAAYPDSNRGWGVAIDPYADAIVGSGLRTSLLALLAAVGGLLLICCANLANLVLARAVARDREVAIRTALGATPIRIARQFLAENVVLALAGTLLGIGAAWAGVRWFSRLAAPGTFPSEAVIGLDARILAFTIIVAALTSLTFALAPVARARNSALAETMRETGRGTTASRGTGRLLDGLVLAEIAISVLLLCCSALLVRNFFGLVNVDTGFDGRNTLTMRLPVPGFPPGSNYGSPEEFKEYLRQVTESTRAIPGVRDVAITSALPLTDCCLYRLDLRIEGNAVEDRADSNGGLYKVVTPSYFSALGLELEKGRFLTDEDTADGRRVIVVNERLADRYFPGQDPIGRRVFNPEIIPGEMARGPELEWEIVGVVRDEKITALDDDTSAVGYVTYAQGPVYFTNLIVTGDIPVASLEQDVRRALREVDPGQAVLDVRTMEQIRSASVGSNRFQAVLLGVFSTAALSLATVGIFGLLAYTVAQRRREIGIRAALGASPGDLLRLVLRKGLSLTLLGLVLGLVTTYALSPLLSPLLYRIDPHDPYLLAGVASLFLLIAGCACVAPALRAAGITANSVLRSE